MDGSHGNNGLETDPKNVPILYFDLNKSVKDSR